MPEQVAIIGPGEAFGTELITAFAALGIQPVIFARNVKKWQIHSAEVHQVVLPQDSIRVAQLINKKKVTKIIYGVRSGKAKEAAAVNKIIKDVQVAAFSAELIYRNIQKYLESCKGRFVVVGGDFGDTMHQAYAGLSWEKAFLHNFVREEGTPRLGLVVIKGKVSTVADQTTVVNALLSSLEGEKLESQVECSPL